MNVMASGDPAVDVGSGIGLGRFDASVGVTGVAAPAAAPTRSQSPSRKKFALISVHVRLSSPGVEPV